MGRGGIGGIFRAVAPIVAAIAAPVLLPGIGALATAGIAGLAGTGANLMTGQKFGDALKGGLLSGAMTYGGSLLSRGFSGANGFMSNVGDAITNDFALNAAGTGAGSLAQGTGNAGMLTGATPATGAGNAALASTPSLTDISTLGVQGGYPLEGGFNVAAANAGTPPMPYPDEGLRGLAASVGNATPAPPALAPRPEVSTLTQIGQRMTQGVNPYLLGGAALLGSGVLTPEEQQQQQTPLRSRVDNELPPINVGQALERNLVAPGADYYRNAGARPEHMYFTPNPGYKFARGGEVPQINLYAANDTAGEQGATSANSPGQGNLGIGAAMTGGVLGSLASLATGIPGLGVAGTALGTAAEFGEAQNALATAAEANPNLGIGSLGPGAYASALANNLSFGMLGTPLGDAMAGAAVAGTSMPGVPGNPANDPDSYAGAQSGGGPGVGEGGAGGTSEAGSSSSSVGDGGASAGGFYYGGGVVRQYARGGHITGPGGGMDDQVPAVINGQMPAALSDGEFVVPADVVSALGDGSTKAGSKALYDLIKAVREYKFGDETQPPKMRQGLSQLLQAATT